MKLTKKQEEIKAKILAGTHVGDLRKLNQEQKKVIYYHYLPHEDLKCEVWDYLGLSDTEFDFWTHEKYNNGLPLINMSEWFEEIEEPSESTKDLREYDEKLLKDYNVFVIENDLEDYLPRARKEFVNKRYTNEALLKEKAEIEQRLKEIEEQLGSEG
jgi:hypothetical protein